MIVKNINKSYVDVNRIGFIKISTVLIINNSKELFRIMSNFLIIDVKEEYNHMLTYKCLCKEFRKLEEEEKIPCYEVNYNSNTNTFKVKEVK